MADGPEAREGGPAPSRAAQTRLMPQNTGNEAETTSWISERNAIGWRIRERHPDRKVLFITAERFMYQKFVTR